MANWDTNINTQDDIWGIGDLCFEYNVLISPSCPTNTPSLSVRFLNDGVKFASDSIQPIDNDGIAWIFNINAKSAIECFFNNEQSLCEPGASTPIMLPQINLTIEVDVWEGTPDDCCLGNTFTDISPITVVVGNYLMKPGINYESFNNAEVLSGTPKRFYTLRPQSSSICLDQSLCLCYLSVVSAGVTITAYGPSNIELWSDFVPDPGITGAFEFACIPVGPANINNMGLAGIIDDEVLYYTVQMGFPLFGVINPVGPPMTFSLEGKCCSGGCKLHYLNCLGAFESIVVDNFPAYQTSASGSTFQKSGGKLPSLREFGTGMIQSFSEDKKVLRITANSKEEAEWLSEIGKSPLIYIEENGGFVSYTRDDFNITYWDQNSGSTTWNLTLTRSYIQASHRN